MGMSGIGSVLMLPLIAVGVIAAAIGGIWLVVKLLMGLGWLLGTVFKGIGAFLGHIFAFGKGEVVDALGAGGGLITSIFYLPLILLNVVVGRWQAANHYGRALESEIVRTGSCLYRVAVGHPARLLGLRSLTHGLEERVPAVVASAPRGKDGRPAFEGYKITGTLTPGGSGARLFLAEPTHDTLRRYASSGRMTPRQVVIKSFSLAQGSTLPQIVRESRALEAARKLGLVLDHELTSEHFHYVMPYVPGDDLSAVSQKLHGKAKADGLKDEQLREIMSYSADLLETLGRFHDGGLWHKDIKPSNIIISSGRAHLVDFGLITPLKSAMTLTTHGTEYFRDPEMVRMALKGTKVHEVDGVKFDVYGAGAVLYSLIENSFPAHGSLSQITRRCPEALRWIVRRSMADMGNRYGSAREMLADVRAVLSARKPFEMRPADLPSLSGKPGLAAELSRPRDEAPFAWPTAGAPAATVGAGGSRSSSGSRLGWGLVAAVTLLFLVGGGAAFTFLGAASFNASNGARETARSFPSNSNGASPRAHDIRTGWSTTLASEVVVPEPPASIDADGDVLMILDDLPAHMRGDILQPMTAALDMANYTLLGSPASTIEPKREQVLFSRVRKAIGISSIEDPEAHARLAFMLHEIPETELHGILWISLGPDGEIAKRRIFRDARAETRVKAALEGARRTGQRSRGVQAASSTGNTCEASTDDSLIYAIH